MPCNYRWKAPYIQPDDRVVYVEQVCVEPTGHDGVHRSITNVTAVNVRPRGEATDA